MMLTYINLPQIAAAYKTQVKHDFAFLRKIFDDKTTNNCHKAHALQMCIEKYAKYHQLNSGSQINKQHNWAIKVIPHLFEQRYSNKYPPSQFRKIILLVRDFCKEIDLLAPAHYGSDKQNPVNCEYPWEVVSIKGTNVRAFAPCIYNFRIFQNDLMSITKKLLAMIDEDTK
jgi:hypothetical protein